MMRYQHYSFDLWLTLIRSDPAFKQERTQIFHQHYNSQHKTIAEIAAVFRQVDLMCNAINEKTGKNLDADEMYLMVICLLNEAPFSLQNVDLNALETQMENLFFEHLPLVYSDETIKTLEQICKSGESTISILSNTGFIRGKTLRKMLKQINLDGYFDFQLYSDEAGISKPNPDFLKLMLNQVATIRKTDVDLNQIIHVGDNEIADVEGANAVGIKSLLINSNNQCISSLFK